MPATALTTDGTCSQFQARAARQRNRQQAVAAFPILSALFTPRPRRGDRKNNGDKLWRLNRLPKQSRCRIIQAVDAGERVLPVLTETLNVAPWMLRHLAKHEGAFFKAFRADGIEALASLRWATPEAAPTKVTSLKTLSMLANLRDAPIDWDEADDRAALRRLIEKKVDARRIVNFLKFVRELTDWVSARGCGTPTTTVGESLGIGSVTDWVRLSKCWMTTLLRQPYCIFPEGMVSADREPTNMSWPTAFDGTVSLGGYGFQCLTTREALQAESTQMQHCVARFAVRCIQGGLHILSIRSGEQRIGTAALVHHANRRFEIEQASGVRNVPLALEVLKRLAELATQLNAGLIASPHSAAGTSTDALARYKALREFAAHEYIGASGRFKSLNHFEQLADIFGEAGFEQYRTCLEGRPGRGTLYADTLRAAAKRAGRQ